MKWPQINFIYQSMYHNNFFQVLHRKIKFFEKLTHPSKLYYNPQLWVEYSDYITQLGFGSRTTFLNFGFSSLTTVVNFWLVCWTTVIIFGLSRLGWLVGLHYSTLNMTQTNIYFGPLWIFTSMNFPFALLWISTYMNIHHILVLRC